MRGLHQHFKVTDGLRIQQARGHALCAIYAQFPRRAWGAAHPALGARASQRTVSFPRTGCSDGSTSPTTMPESSMRFG